MILIAHRGNTNGVNPEKENTVAYIKDALKQGYHCEIDICKFDGKQFYLGHDEPQEAVSIEFLRDNPLWCHAKNFNALQAMIDSGIHCFWHNTDKYTITSKGIIWAYPGEKVDSKSIAVLPEKHDIDLSDCMGVCSDYVERYK
jgi:glycerophosphoryl diester phosphodiesterase